MTRTTERTAVPTRLILLDALRSLERRVRALEGESPDAVTIQDDDGVTRLQVGLQADGSFAIKAYDSGGILTDTWP